MICIFRIIATKAEGKVDMASPACLIPPTFKQTWRDLCRHYLTHVPASAITFPIPNPVHLFVLLTQNASAALCCDGMAARAALPPPSPPLRLHGAVFKMLATRRHIFTVGQVFDKKNMMFFLSCCFSSVVSCIHLPLFSPSSSILPLLIHRHFYPPPPPSLGL